MQTYINSNNTVPEAIQDFLVLAQKSNKILQLEDLLDLNEKLLQTLADHPDWLKIEDTIDGIAEKAKKDEISVQDYVKNLTVEFNSIYPFQAPYWTEVIKTYLNKIGNSEYAQIVESVGGALPLFLEYLTIEEKINEICLKQGIDKKNHGSFFDVMRDATTSKIKKEDSSFSVCIDKYKVESLSNTAPKEIEGIFETAKKSGFKKERDMFGLFGKEVVSKYPRSKANNQTTKQTEKKKPEDRKEIKENILRYIAVADLLIGDLTEIDPVIGDEACEARPPVILDIYQKLIETCGDDYKEVVKWCQAFLWRHDKDSKVITPSDKISVETESHLSQKFVDFCIRFSKECTDDEWNYLFYCKAATYTSRLVSDEYEMVSYDRYNSNYIKDDRSRLRKSVGSLSCYEVKKMAKFVLEQEGCNKDFWSSVVNILEGCNAFKFDQNDKKEMEFSVSLLPIYETMRTVFAYQFLKGRPIVLSICRIQCEPEESEGNEEDVDAREAKYKIIDIPIFVYRPDPKRGNFVCSEVLPDDNEPCFTIQAYQLVDKNIPTKDLPEDCNFMMSLEKDYNQEISGCDIGLLTMIYSSIHPVLAGGAQIGDDVLEKTGLPMIQSLYKKFSKFEIDTEIKNVPLTKLSFNLCNPKVSLAEEYGILKNFGFSCDLSNKQYITRPGGKQTCARSLTSVGFTIHHINVQRYGMIKDKAKKAMNTEDLPRFYNFDAGKSFGTLKESLEFKK
ncbi:hypothetical protein [Govanella unica]|uniref:Uncharacterized protein n=1 Tax=Govanella unica TaxID=2975056 RepID=A0A9X3TYQ5_9PROT|nr:hypothetical protein [Govania unica]MDA5193974.1 hypothetical protein [Govania unica]